MFITLEGGEGSGKSTQARLLKSYFPDAILTREPGGTTQAEKIRNLLLDRQAKYLTETEILLFFAARNEHIENLIKPALKSGKMVICDRFIDSTIAYQKYGHGYNGGLIDNLESYFLENLTPNLTFIFDINPEIAFERVKSRGTQDHYEQLDMQFHHNVHQGFLEIAKNSPQRCKIIDATMSEYEIHQIILQKIALCKGLKLNCG